MLNEDLFNLFLESSLKEDIGDGDHSSLACIPEYAAGSANLLVKDEGIIAGVNTSKIILQRIDPGLDIEIRIDDGNPVKTGDIIFVVSGSIRSILKSERLVLNVMQRMSGIATKTSEYVQQLKGLKTRVLDTRKTAPGLRIFDKEAVRLGGGMNHRMGLFDMIMLKDNHIDFAGGIESAILKTVEYLEKEGKNLDIEIEARNLDDVRKILKVGKIQRIMLDNFSLEDTRKAVDIIAGRYETESSGKITLENIREYAECGVDFISAGALTHHVKSLDLSLKAI